MSCLKQLYLSFCTILACSQAHAQATANRMMPPVVNMRKQGWEVTLQQGNLTFGLPITTVPGEVSIPVAFGMNATYTSNVWITRPYDPDLHIRIPVTNEIDRPMVGGVHFGYISDSEVYSGTTVPGLTILEDGNQIADTQWTAFSTAGLGTTLNLPQAYGFTAVATGTAKVDPTATYLSYTTNLTGLKPVYQPIVQALTPSGFGTGTTSYKVVMDKNKARVFAYATSVHAWVPVLWADRFGHFVTFQWIRSTTGLPAGITAITKVTATNQRSKGVILRWANYTSNVEEVDILRLDFVGMNAPSVVIKGYPGFASNAPVGAIDPIPDNRWRVVPSVIGSVCRPKSIQIGAFGNISQPIWSGSGSPAAVTPGAPPADGTTASALQTWTFAYDANGAELTSYTDPRGLTTSFSYTNYGLASAPLRGVSRVDAIDSDANKLSKRWTRTIATSTTPLKVKVEGWWDPNLAVAPDRYHQFEFPTDTLNQGNGVYQTDSLMDTLGKTWSTTTYTYSQFGAGLTAELSSVQSVSIQQDKAPTITTAFGYQNTNGLQMTQQVVSATDSANKVYQIIKTNQTYGTRWDMLEGHQLTQVVTTRYAPDGVIALAPVTQKFEYDTPASGPALLQLLKSYLDGGSAGRHGTTFGYDGDGRSCTQDIYHVEGSLLQPSPNHTQVAYDTASGVVASQTVTDNTAPVQTQTMSQSQGSIDTSGRPTTLTDAAGITTTYSYDDRGRTLSISRSGSPTVTYAYPEELRTTITINGQITESVFDGFGRIRQKTVPTGILAANGSTLVTTQTPSYDLYGRQVSLTEINPANTGRTKSWGYDIFDRVISEAPFAGGPTTTSYDVAGINTKVTTTSPNQVSSYVLVDPLGQIVETVSPDGAHTKATYNGAGQRVALTVTPDGGPTQPRSWDYDALGRLTSKSEPETNTQTFSQFNALNQATVVIEAAQAKDLSQRRTRTLTFDGLGRMKTVSNGEDLLSYGYTGPNLTFSSRKVGGVTVIQTFAYNGAGGLLSSETTTQPGLSATVGYGYDTLGRLQTLTYPDNRIVTYGYDALSRIINIKNNGVPLINNITFDDWGNRWQTFFASGAQDQWDADLSGTRLKTWNIGYVGGGPDGRSYTYDDATNILKTAGEWTLTHDSMGRIKNANGFGLNTTHGYDAFGNGISHKVDPNPNPVPPAFNSFSFDPLPNNQIPGQDKSGASTGWNTNLRGEATQVGSAIGAGSTPSVFTLNLGWDGLGLLRSVAWISGNQTFQYAPSGMRVDLTDTVTNGNNRKYVYTSAGILLGEYRNPAGTPIWNRDVIYLGSEAIAEIGADGIHELHSDHLGSPRLITKGNGTWASSLVGTAETTLAYGAFGELVQQTGTYSPLTGYTGHIETDASGLLYMRGRYYSPSWHAFVNSDQGVDSNSLNQRAYVGGSPLHYTDPSGMAIFIGPNWKNILLNLLRYGIVPVIDYMPGPWSGAPPMSGVEGEISGMGASRTVAPSPGGAAIGAQQKPNLKNKTQCKTSWLPKSIGAQIGLQVDDSGSALSSQGNAGLLITPLGEDNGGGLDLIGGFISGGSFDTSKKTRDFIFGWFRGGGLSGVISNAQKTSDIRGDSKTFTMNVGTIIPTYGGSFSISPDGIWVLTIGLPKPAAGLGASFTCYDTTTKTTGQ